MKANCLILSNAAEMDKADDMNLKVNPIYIKRAFLFNINDVEWAALNSDNNIEMSVRMSVVTIEFDNTIWEKLKLKFNA